MNYFSIKNNNNFFKNLKQFFFFKSLINDYNNNICMYMKKENFSKIPWVIFDESHHPHWPTCCIILMYHCIDGLKPVDAHKRSIKRKKNHVARCDLVNQNTLRNLMLTLLPSNLLLFVCLKKIKGCETYYQNVWHFIPLFGKPLCRYLKIQL